MPSTAHRGGWSTPRCSGRPVCGGPASAWVRCKSHTFQAAQRAQCGCTGSARIPQGTRIRRQPRPRALRPFHGRQPLLQLPDKADAAWASVGTVYCVRQIPGLPD